MKAAIWIVSGVLAALWTGGAFVAAWFVDWAAGLIASGAALDLAKNVAAWPLPRWLEPWVDAAAFQALQHLLVDLMSWLRAAWPGLVTMVGWLVPLVWGLWAVGLGLLLALSVFGHWLAGRAQAPQPSVA